MRPSSFVTSLLFNLSLILNFVHVKVEGKCVCKAPKEIEGMVVVSGQKTCQDMTSLPRTVFRYKDSADCKGVQLKISDVKERLVLASSYFDGPSLAFSTMTFSKVCIAEISSNFFPSFISSDKLAFIKFDTITCLKRIRRGVFNGLPKVKQLRISDCTLTTIEEGAFRDLESLKELEITNTALRVLPNVLLKGKNSLTDIDLSQNQIELLSSTFFEFPSTKPLRINLSNNKLSTLPSDIFKKLNLLELNLSKNKLARLSFSFGDFTLSNLQKMDVHGNVITSLDEKLMKTLDKKKFDFLMENNRLDCTCSAVWMLTNTVLRDSGTTCSTPVRLSAQTIESLTKEQFCPTASTMGGRGYNTITDSSATKKPRQLKGAGMGSGVQSQEIIAIVVAVVVIVVGLVTVFLIYRFRSRLSCSKKNKGEMKAQYIVANTKEPDGGYNGEPVARETYVV